MIDLVNHTRPVIIFGPFKELLNDQLLNDRPDKFANCVPRMYLTKKNKYAIDEMNILFSRYQST